MESYYNFVAYCENWGGKGELLVKFVLVGIEHFSCKKAVIKYLDNTFPSLKNLFALVFFFIQFTSQIR